MIGFRLRWGPRLLPDRLPLGRDEARRFLPWVLALMVYVAGLSGVGLIALHGMLRAAEGSLATSLTVQVPADASSLRLETVMAVLRRTKGITSAHLFEPAETQKLLEPWLGPAVPLDELPVPRLIDVQIDPAATPDLATLRRQLASVLPEAQLDDHRPAFDGMRAAARSIEIILAAAAVAALILIAAATVFAVRTALMVRRSDIEVVHLLGAPDANIARQLATRYLWLGLFGGGAGAVLALLTVVVLEKSGPLIQLPAPVGMSGVADWRFWAVLIGVVGAAGLIAMASAQLTALRWLARMP